MGIFVSKYLEESQTIPATGQQQSISDDPMAVVPYGKTTYYRMRMSFVRHALSCANMYIKTMGYGKGLLGAPKGSYYGKNADLCSIGGQQSRQLGMFLQQTFLSPRNKSNEYLILVVSELLRTQETMLISCLDILTPYLQSGRRVVVCPFLNEEQSILPDWDFITMKDRDNVPSSLPETKERFQTFVHALFAPNNVYGLKPDHDRYPYLFDTSNQLLPSCWSNIFDTEIFYGTGANTRPFPYGSKETRSNAIVMEEIQNGGVSNLSKLAVQTTYTKSGKMLYSSKQFISNLHALVWNYMKRYADKEVKQQFVKQLYAANGTRDTIKPRLIFFGHHHTIKHMITKLLPDTKPYFKQYQIMNAEYIDINRRSTGGYDPLTLEIDANQKLVKYTIPYETSYIPKLVQAIRRYPLNILFDTNGKMIGSEARMRPTPEFGKTKEDTYPYIIYLPTVGLFMDQTLYTAASIVQDGKPVKLAKPILTFLQMTLKKYDERLQVYEDTLNTMQKQWIKKNNTPKRSSFSVDMEQWLPLLKELRSSIGRENDKNQTVLSYLSNQSKVQRKQMIDALLKDLVSLCTLGSKFLEDPSIQSKVASLLEHGDLAILRQQEWAQLKGRYNDLVTVRHKMVKQREELLQKMKYVRNEKKRNEQIREITNAYNKDFVNIDERLDPLIKQMEQIKNTKTFRSTLEENVNKVGSNTNMGKKLSAIRTNVNQTKESAPILILRKKNKKNKKIANS